MSGGKLFKAIVFTAKAHERDTSTKIKSVVKWLKSGIEVRVQINGSEDRFKSIESIYKQIENDTRSGANYVQKVVKPNSIKVVLQPTEEAANLHLDDDREKVNVEQELDGIIADKDIFSKEFEEELLKSIRKDKSKNKRANDS